VITGSRYCVGTASDTPGFSINDMFMKIVTAVSIPDVSEILPIREDGKVKFWPKNDIDDQLARRTVLVNAKSEYCVTPEPHRE